MLPISLYKELYNRIVDAGYGEEIVWQESLKPCESADEFAQQYIWVVLSAGMKNQIARKIEARIYQALREGKPLTEVFNHKGKVHAILTMLAFKDEIFADYQKAEDKIQFLRGLKWIGDITKFHLAKNLGFDCVKPDRHLVRIAEQYQTTPDELCTKIAVQTGQRKATVDLVIWRAANLGWI